MKSRKFLADHKYLLLPLAKAGGWFLPQDQVQYIGLYTNGVLREEIETILSETPRTWGVLYLEAYRDEEIEIRMEGGDEEQIRLLRISDQMPDEDTLYHEPGRALVHFTPMRGFMNDPNGLLYYRGTYHLFAQLNPYGFGAGNTHWLHAVSSDLMHWEEKPYALLPDAGGRMYSGGGVVDLTNSSGMKTGEHDPIFLFYTDAGCKTRWSQGKYFTICAAVSLDGGARFTKYEGNPLFPHKSFLNRDPKVLRDPVNGEWIMMIYTDGDRYTLFFSKDLLHWEEGETIRGYCSAECPDLFWLDLDGDPEKRKLVLWFCADNYMIGQMKDRRFIRETEIIEGPSHQIFSDYPNLARTSGGYASQTFTNAPDGRVIQLSWLMTDPGNAPYVSTMSIPNELRLVSTAAGPRISVLPVQEVRQLAQNTFSFKNRGFEEFSRIPRDAFGESMDIRLRMTVREGQLLALSVRGILVVYDDRLKRLILPTGAYHIDLTDGHLDLRFITDRTSVEIYTADGLFNTTVKGMAPSPFDLGIRHVFVEADTGIDVEVTKLNGIWK